MKKSQIKWNVSKLEKLPTLSAVATELVKLTMDETSDAQQVAAIIETDQSLASKVLQIVNSASYGFSGRVTTMAHAVSLLGFSTVRSLALSMTVSDMFGPSEEPGAFDRTGFWKHSLACAVCAELIAERVGGRYAEEAFLAGLLHDIGKVALDTCAREDFDRVIREAAAKHISVLEAEKQVMETDHAVVGKWVAERWGLPDMFTHAIWLHHQPPGTLPESGFDKRLVEIVHLANIVVRSQMIGAGGDSRVYPVPQRLLSSLNLKEDHLEDIKERLWKLVEERASIVNLQTTEKGLYLESLQRANQELSRMALTLQEHNRDLGRKANRLAVLHDMNTRMLPSHGLSEMLNIVATSLRDGLRVPCGFLFMADGEREILVGKIWTGEGENLQDLLLPLGNRLEKAQGPAQLDAEITETIQDTSLGVKDSSWIGERITDIVYKNNLVLVPMVSQGKSVGQIVIDNRENSINYTDKELEELLTFGSAAGVAVSRYRLQEKLNERSEELATAIWREEQAREQLMRNERLASVGKMAAGAAHEINNPLAVISGRAQMLLTDEKDEKKANALKLMVQQTRRASKILTDLMGFARPAMPKAEPTNVNFVIHHVLSMVEAQLKLKNIECQREFLQGLPKISADKHQLEQVFLNIVLNAEHAMEEGGTLTVSTSLSPAKDRILIKFTDTGKGIPKEDLPHVFEPFFTTKEEGEGTGLGLAMSYGIVTSHDGTIDVESRVGEGTTFTVTLPVVLDVKQIIAKAEPPVQKKVAAPSRKPAAASILIVDDEEHIRDLLSDTLAMRGYQVETAENGLTALKVLNDKPVDLLLLDMRMPVKDGLGLLDEIKERLPQLPVIIVTGLASNEEIQEALERGAFSCLRKPFQIDTLVEEVDKALAKRGKPARKPKKKT